MVCGSAEGELGGFGAPNIVFKISRKMMRRGILLRWRKIVVLVMFMRFRSGDVVEKVRIRWWAGRKCRIGVAFHNFWVTEPETEAEIRMLMEGGGAI